MNVVRGLAIDGVQAANSGHPGLPLGAAPMAVTLWRRHLKANPADPAWINRDRFILSAGHGSMLLYSLLHVAGYALPLEELKRFRQWGSLTPGHPENHLTPGVEMATGPLGQGLATAVGMAIAETHLAAQFNRPGHPVIDHFTYVICSDGDLMEGVAQEGCSLAGHLRLGKLIALYDDNQISIDGSTGLAFTDDTRAKFDALGWHTLRVEDGNDLDAIDAALRTARAETERPSLILVRTVIGFGSPNKAGSPKAHGAPLGPDEVRLTKAALGLPEDEAFYVSDDVRGAWAETAAAGAAAQTEWNQRFAAYREAFPAEAEALEAALRGDLPEGLLAALPTFSEPIATRNASLKTIQAIAAQVPYLLGGCADLAESVLTTIQSSPAYQPECRTGRNVMYGVREHGMAAAVNGLNLHGGTRAFGGTFLIFSDYCKPSLRLAALMGTPSVFVFSHDSIGVGEDGPTHQPIEQIAGLRAIPNFDLLRPADGNETAVCWAMALERQDGPTALILTRQALPVCTPVPSADHPAYRGGYVLAEADGGDPKVVLVVSGSEVGLALAARDVLQGEGIPVRVVNLVSWMRYEQQPAEYRNATLPWGIPTVSIEAASTFGWGRYADTCIGLDRFGASAPGGRLMQEFGFTPEAVADVVRARLGQ